MKRTIAIAVGAALGLLVAGAVPAFAARNSSGTYSLPSGNPVASGAPISSAWANSTLGDLATEVTSSLDRSGRGGMLAPLKVPDGSASAPTLSFTNEPGSGLYRIGSNNLGLAVGGVKRAEWTSSGEAISGTLSTTGAASFGGSTAVTGTLSVSSTSTLSGQVTAPAGVTGLPTPSGSSDATPKGYVDAANSSLSGTISALANRIATGRTSIALNANATASATVTLSPSFADTNYTASCTGVVDSPAGVSGTSGPTLLRVYARSGSQVSVVLQNTWGTNTVTSAHCIAVHD